MDIFCRYSEIVYKKYLSVQIYFQNGRLSILLSQFYHQLFTIIALLCFSIQRQTTFLKLNIVHDRTPCILRHEHFINHGDYGHISLCLFFMCWTQPENGPLSQWGKPVLIVTQFKNITFFVLVGWHQISRDN